MEITKDQNFLDGLFLKQESGFWNAILDGFGTIGFINRAKFPILTDSIKKTKEILAQIQDFEKQWEFLNFDLKKDPEKLWETLYSNSRLNNSYNNYNVGGINSLLFLQCSKKSFEEFKTNFNYFIFLVYYNDQKFMEDLPFMSKNTFENTKKFFREIDSNKDKIKDLFSLVLVFFKEFKLFKILSLLFNQMSKVPPEKTLEILDTIQNIGKNEENSKDLLRFEETFFYCVNFFELLKNDLYQKSALNETHIQNFHSLLHEIFRRIEAENQNKLEDYKKEVLKWKDAHKKIFNERQTQLIKVSSKFQCEIEILKAKIKEKEDNEIAKKNEKFRKRVTKYKNLLQEKEEELQTALENNKSLKKEIKILKKDLQENNQSKDQLSGKQDFSSYDLIFHIDSLQSARWNISFISSHNLTSSFASIIGFVGRENIGKTFILNKICGFELPTGANVHTKGLSVKFSSDQSFLCLDSAGAQTPVYYYARKVMKRFNHPESDELNDDIKTMMINDRTLTDYFIQDFILEKSQIIIIVVGQLSQNDQKLIERICKEYKAKKRIIIIHNMFNLEKKVDVERRIKKDIMESCKAMEVLIPQSELYQYVEKTKDKSKQNISHFVLGAENKESGNYYNKVVFEYLKKIIDTDVEKKAHDLISDLREYFNDNYRRYLKFSQRPKTPIELLFDSKECALNIKCQEKYEISNPLFNSLGSFIANPPYEVFKTKEEYICLIEIPNLNLDTLNLSINKKKSEFNLLVLKGEKKEEIISKGEMIVGFRNNGEFLNYFPLGPNYEMVKIDENSKKYKSGLFSLRVIYNLEEIINL